MARSAEEGVYCSHVATRLIESATVWAILSAGGGAQKPESGAGRGADEWQAEASNGGQETLTKQWTQRHRTEGSERKRVHVLGVAAYFATALCLSSGASWRKFEETATWGIIFKPKGKAIEETFDARLFATLPALVTPSDMATWNNQETIANSNWLVGK